MASVTLRQALPEFRWNRDGFDGQGGEALSRNLFRLELPLLMEENGCFGILVLVKDLRNHPSSHYALKRVEHLRRTLVRTLQDILPPRSPLTQSIEKTLAHLHFPLGD
ncbi:MAG: hypothetical protein JEZ11_28320 [Desulfobacterales bacterium]|nr:hypothetical protein [Desulfobacterales bacterium]